MKFLGLLAAGAAFLAFGDPVLADKLPEPKSVTIDKSLSADQAFWDTGDAQFARLALADNFTDRTLPKGRLQGVEGPIVASHNFRQAVPDLRCEIEQLIVGGDRVIAHLRFRGHFTGAFGQKQGRGQTVDFIATDILRVQDGRITDNWHIEDNLTLMQQLGIVQL